MRISCMTVAMCAAFAAAAGAGELQPGDTAPNFELTGSDGKTYKLSDFQNKQTVVLAWFPKAFTGG